MDRKKDILERAIEGEDRALWARIGEQASVQMRMKRLAAGGVVFAALLMALGVMALIGLNAARAGREGWLANLFAPVLEAQIYKPPAPGENPDFLPIKLEDGTWEMVEDNTEAVLTKYLPMDLPEGYTFISGDIRQPDRDTIDMTLKYEIDGRAFCIKYQYRYGDCPGIGDTDSAGVTEWGGASVSLWEGTENKAAWLEEDIYTVICIEGDIGAGEIAEVYRSIEKEYIDELTRGVIEAGQ